MIPPFVIMMKEEMTTSGMMELVTAIFKMACSDYTVAYYNTHFDIQEYRDYCELSDSEEFILNSDLLSFIFSDDERYNIIVKLRKKVINDHSVYRSGSKGNWKVIPEGMRAHYET